MLDQTLFERFPKDVAALPSRVLSSLSSVTLLDPTEPIYETFSKVSIASSLGVILVFLSPVAHDDSLFDNDFETKR